MPRIWRWLWVMIVRLWLRPAPSNIFLTEKGWQRIDVLKENESKAKDRVLIPAADRGLVFKPSSYLKPIAFTKGPEEKPVIRIQTLDNLAVEMTELHPVPIKQGKSIEMVQEIGLVEIIDNLAGVDKNELVTTGQATLAMVINCLGFVSRPLYITSQFFKSRLVEFLIGKSKN